MASGTCHPDLQSLVEKKTKIRMALRQEFIKQVYNPHRHATGAGGTIFDPAHQRFMTMTNNRHLYFRPTPKTTMTTLAIFVIPTILICKFILGAKAKDEQLLRTGQVSYRDRNNKFL